MLHELCSCGISCHRGDGPLGRYLDAADGLLGLHHADVLGWVPLRQQLGGAQVVSGEDDPIDEVLWLTGAGH